MKNFANHKHNVQTILKELQGLIKKLGVLEDEILNQEEILTIISEFAYDWEYWQGIDREYKYVSPSCEVLTGYSPAEFYANPHLLKKIIVEKDWSKWQKHRHTMTKNNQVEPLEFEIRTKSGETKWIHHVCRTVINSRGQSMGIRGSNRDITDLKKIQKRLQHVAGHDELTGLANRSLLLEYLKQTLKEAKRNKGMFAVAFIDLDRFKEINDTYGHDAGDHVLRKVAQNLQNNLRADDIIARFGGDEFVGVFSINKALDVTTLQKKIFDQINTHIDCTTFQITIELSVGISIYPTDGSTVDALLSKADNEMYIMKAKNKKKRKKEEKKKNLQDF